MCSNNWPLKTTTSLKGTNLPNCKCIWGGTRDMNMVNKTTISWPAGFISGSFYFLWKLFATPGSKTADFLWNRRSGDSHDEMIESEHTLGIFKNGPLRFFSYPPKTNMFPKKGTISNGHLIWTNHWFSVDMLASGSAMCLFLEPETSVYKLVVSIGWFQIIT